MYMIMVVITIIHFLHCDKYATCCLSYTFQHGFSLIQRQKLYYIRSVHAPEYVLTAPADPNDGTITMSPKSANEDPNQLWSIEDNSNGTITIISQGYQAYALDAEELIQEGDPVVLKPFEENKPSQQWDCI